MKLFDDFEAVKFTQENLIFITQRGYIYYVYNPKYNRWYKYRNCGNDHITVANYENVTKKELMDAMNGLFPRKETDFMRLCNPSQLWIRDMLNLLGEDYERYFADYSIRHSIHKLLLESNICHKSFLEIKKLLDNSLSVGSDVDQVLNEIKELSFKVMGRDIFKKEIGIVDGHNSSSYFWIMPVRVIDHFNTDDINNIAEMRAIEISIEEDDVAQYLTPFLYKYFDDELEANKERVNDRWVDDDGNEQISRVKGFEWYLTYNFFTFDSIKNILKDITDTIDALLAGRENEYTATLIEKRGSATYELIYARDLDENEIEEYNANRPTKDDTELELIIDFYRRFLYRMEYMLKVGEEKGYNLISFMGP